MNKAYEKLLAQYKGFIDRKAAALADIDAGIDAAEKEIAGLKLELAKGAGTMGSEYRTKKKRLEDLENDIQYLNSRKTEIENSPNVSDEEYQVMQKAFGDEVTRMNQECAEAFYGLLSHLFEAVRKYNTDFSVMSALQNSFEKTVGKRHGIDRVPAPDYLTALAVVSLVYFNKLRNARGETTLTSAANDDELREELNRIYKVNSAVGYGGLASNKIHDLETAFYAVQRMNL